MHFSPLPAKKSNLFTSHWTADGHRRLVNCLSLFKPMKRNNHQNVAIEKNKYPIKCPYLFHKELLNISSPFYYEVKREVKRRKRNVCSIICFKLSFLRTYFGEFLDDLYRVFDIVVSYVLEDDLLCDKFTYLKGKNVGLDIGHRFYVTDYLQNNYDYLFYIHSKSNEKKRQLFITPFVHNLRKIEERMDKKEIGGIFHSQLRYGNFDFNSKVTTLPVTADMWTVNNCYMEEICEYMNLPKDFFLFSEGNFYVIHQTVNNILFTDKRLFGCLNDENSFDYNWTVQYYKDNNPDIHALYRKYLLDGRYGNNTYTALGWNGLADCMVEHVFERITMTVVKSVGRDFEVLDYCSSGCLALQCGRVQSSSDVLVVVAQNVNGVREVLLDNLSKFQTIICVLHIALFDTFEYPDMNDSFCSMDCRLTDTSLIQYRHINPNLTHLTDEEVRRHFYVRQQNGLASLIIGDSRQATNIRFLFTHETNNEAIKKHVAFFFNVHSSIVWCGL